jgi:hypothetical protein
MSIVRSAGPDLTGPGAIACHHHVVTPPISDRALYRALLARQHLLERTRVPARDVIEHLVVLQAQVPVDPYVALWSRIVDLDPAEPSGLLERRETVRAPLHRATIHLATADDALDLYPLIRPVLDRMYRSGSPFGRILAAEGTDPDPAMAMASELMGERPRTRAELRSVFAERFPSADASALSYAATLLLPLVQATPRGLWRRPGAPAFARLDTWLDRPVPETGDLEWLVLRYLGAYGPASVMDMQAWCGLTRLDRVFERLRPRLVTFRANSGRELFDLPESPRPAEGTPAPVRFLPQYDDVALGHADRARIVPPAMVARPYTQLWVGSFLVDGFGAGLWRIEERTTPVRMELEVVGAVTDTDREELLAEGARLLAFLRPGVAGGVGFVDRIP